MKQAQDGRNPDHWWTGRPRRLLQTNLREIDINFDPGEYLDQVKKYKADTLIFNVGGIVANYDSALAFHYRNPFLRDEVLTGLIRAVQDSGIRFVARFDFSKVNERVAQGHPEWHYRSATGKDVVYNEQVHVCVNSWYQQEGSMQILEECLHRYPVDGVFFNMPGFVTSDYDGNEYGPCHCEACTKLFREAYGLELPLRESPAEAGFQAYETFKSDVSRSIFATFRSRIKAVRDVAIFNYSNWGVDVFRNESNSGIDRRPPEWNYSAVQNVQSVLTSWPGMAACNSAVHFVDYPFRQSAVSEHLSALRAVQGMVLGGWLDFFVIGHLHQQKDRTGLERMQELFAFHEKHAEHYTGLSNLAELCLVEPDWRKRNANVQEFRGLLRILAENHILFDILNERVFSTPEIAGRLEKYSALILPDIIFPDSGSWGIVDSFVQGGGKVLVTGHGLLGDEKSGLKMPLQSAGILEAGPILDRKRSGVFMVTGADRELLGTLDDLDIVYFDSSIATFEAAASAIPVFSRVKPAMFGPPEKCYWTTDMETGTPGAVLNLIRSTGTKDGAVAWIPWTPGSHYEHFSNHAHGAVIRGILVNAMRVRCGMDAGTTSPLVFVTVQEKTTDSGKRQLLASFVNMSGQLGTAFHAPVTMSPIQVRLDARIVKKLVPLRNSGPSTGGVTSIVRDSEPATGGDALTAQDSVSATRQCILTVQSLVSGSTTTIQPSSDGSFLLEIPALGLFETLVIEQEHA